MLYVLYKFKRQRAHSKRPPAASSAASPASQPASRAQPASQPTGVANSSAHPPPNTPARPSLALVPYLPIPASFDDSSSFLFTELSNISPSQVAL
ncbi:hypothetical protein PCANC_12041 [Puccinia coronata f. sp. avenae]|uniref:Uncharacterized protein n=1 Tax=Puccinia coronata f. sp. avenae TaxID=200324 RepID=A0A2N5TNH3_9BASI|nr:hypothetical protein PCANC_24227 [Puccinia coronata f. sp. avenae]PLW27049.1 hypothetical protein PCANC_22057 [Puccinia coronata f. sp. avenae]PLW41423.1 hypothetical protein PCANC_12041 [Puccinia coronata f. sp. avenae]